MYYRLKSDYLLRGWKLLPTGIVRKTDGGVAFLDKDSYATLRKLTGVMDSESFLFSDAERETIKLLDEKELLEKSKEPSPIEPEQEYKFYENRFMREVHWLLTGRCNCRCKHCYMSAPRAAMGEFSYEACMDLIAQMAECGVQGVTLSGGEPLIRDDFFEIVGELLKNGIHIRTIMSNGLLVNEELLDALEWWGIKPHISMSFDGAGCHDWLRGVGGAEKAVLRAFELCRERGIRTSAEMCLHKGNRHALQSSVRLLASLGVKSLKVSPLDLTGEGAALADYAISAEESYETYLEYIPNYYSDNAPMRLMLSGFFLAQDSQSYRIPYAKMKEDSGDDAYCLCGHARNVMLLSADGRILPCIPVGSANEILHHFPHLENARLKDILTDSSYFDFVSATLGDYFKNNNECAKCEYRYRCAGGCRGRAAEKSGVDSFWAIDKDACDFFKKGYYDRLVKMMDGLGIEKKGA